MSVVPLILLLTCPKETDMKAVSFTLETLTLKGVRVYTTHGF